MKWFHCQNLDIFRYLCFKIGESQPCVAYKKVAYKRKSVYSISTLIHCRISPPPERKTWASKGVWMSSKTQVVMIWHTLKWFFTNISFPMDVMRRKIMKKSSEIQKTFIKSLKNVNANFLTSNLNIFSLKMSQKIVRIFRMIPRTCKKRQRCSINWVSIDTVTGKVSSCRKILD